MRYRSGVFLRADHGDMLYGAEIDVPVAVLSDGPDRIRRKTVLRTEMHGLSAVGVIADHAAVICPDPETSAGIHEETHDVPDMLFDVHLIEADSVVHVEAGVGSDPEIPVPGLGHGIYLRSQHTGLLVIDHSLVIRIIIRLLHGSVRTDRHGPQG